MKQVHRVLTETRFEEWGDMELLQQDIAGFYNQVSHVRILDCLADLLLQFCEQQQLTLDDTMSVSLKRKEKQNRVFRGSWRRSGRAVKSIVLRQVLPLTSLLLKHSIFVAGTQVYTQIQGASMGSQWAPILCSLVALHQESIFQKVCSKQLIPLSTFPTISIRWQSCAPFSTQLSKWSWIGPFPDFRLFWCANHVGRRFWLWDTWLSCAAIATEHVYCATLG